MLAGDSLQVVFTGNTLERSASVSGGYSAGSIYLYDLERSSSVGKGYSAGSIY